MINNLIRIKNTYPGLAWVQIAFRCIIMWMGQCSRFNALKFAVKYRWTWTHNHTNWWCYNTGRCYTRANNTQRCYTRPNVTGRCGTNHTGWYNSGWCCCNSWTCHQAFVSNKRNWTMDNGWVAWINWKGGGVCTSSEYLFGAFYFFCL